MYRKRGRERARKSDKYISEYIPTQKMRKEIIDIATESVRQKKYIYLHIKRK